MSLYEGAKTWASMDSKFSDEFRAKVGMDQGSVLLFLQF